VNVSAVGVPVARVVLLCESCDFTQNPQKRHLEEPEIKYYP